MSVLSLLTVGAALAQGLAVHGEVVYPVSGPPIADGLVFVDDAGRIAYVGPADGYEPPAEAVRHEGAVVTPGLIDAWTTAGLTGPLNHRADQDHAERNDPVGPQLRALDGYHPADPLVGWIRQLGVTTALAAPSPGQPVGGQGVVVHTWDRADFALDVVAPQIFTLGDGAKSRFSDEGAASRMGAAATIRQTLAEAQEYAERRALRGAERASVDLGMDALGEVLVGERRAVFHAHRADDIRTALRIGEEFGLDVVIAGGAEAWLVVDELVAAEVPVLVGPVMARSWRAGDQRNSNFETAGLLAQAGVPVGIMSGYEGYVPKVRVVLWEAAIAGANGLGFEGALRALTLAPAEILGVDDRVGSLEPGKEGTFVVWDGDPFEYASHACLVVIAGEPVSQSCH